nr:uncharacterized protein LOC112021000 [Quercus suber]
MIRILAFYSDKVEQYVLENAPKSAKYTSPTIQKEILHVIAIGSSCKCNDELRATQAAEIARMLAIDELEMGTGANQIGTLKRAGDSRWGSHFNSICNLVRMFGPTCLVLENIKEDGSIYLQRGDANVEHYHFDIFNATIDVQLQELDNSFGEQPIELLKLCSALDPKDAYKSFNVDDICCLVEKYYPLDFSERDRTVSTATSKRAFSAMKIVKTRLRNKMEDEFLSNNLVVYIEREIAENFTTDSILDDFRSLKELGSSCKCNDELRATQAAEIARMLAIDELEMGTGANQIGTLKRAGDSRWGSHFNSICNLVRMFGPTCLVLENIKEDGSIYLQRGDANVEHYHFDIFNATIDVQLQELDNSFGEQPIELLKLCSALDPKDAYKSFNVDDICCLVEKYYPLDFSERDRTVSTATSKRAFSAMKIVKTRLRNKMEDEFLSNNLVVYIEREIAENFTTDSILDDFRSLKERRLQF